ncbi:MAG: hypothetical protein SGJ27_25430 [Candidatus Melainabacteria bacterium]|nr:hypothetical protein [Candidatus Melainabacteria bacterium]
MIYRILCEVMSLFPFQLLRSKRQEVLKIVLKEHVKSETAEVVKLIDDATPAIKTRTEAREVSVKQLHAAIKDLTVIGSVVASAFLRFAAEFFLCETFD